ncbi:MAG TPA: Uma2 family endonuclease [Pyrinomonadaceae bacterium]|nr:Uma2 family endonuclease [Pyrinomonadaceae bacterium]
MSSLPEYYLDPKDYLAIERRAEYKSEYVDGVMYARAGGSERHNLIAANLITAIGVQLRDRPCRVYPSDLKVRVPDSKRFFYPDVSIVCGETRFADDERDVVLNPVVVVEVLSESTAAFDRGKNFSLTGRSNPCANICWCRRTNMWSSTFSDRMTGTGFIRRPPGWTKPSLSRL